MWNGHPPNQLTVGREEPGLDESYIVCCGVNFKRKPFGAYQGYTLGLSIFYRIDNVNE